MSANAYVRLLFSPHTLIMHLISEITLVILSNVPRNYHLINPTPFYCIPFKVVYGVSVPMLTHEKLPKIESPRYESYQRVIWVKVILILIF